jgi:hypothetical protein
MALGFSLVVIAAGAVMRYAYSPTTPTHGFNVGTAGGILMVVGIIGAVLSMTGWFIQSRRHQRTTAITEPGGRVVRRDDVESTTTSL